MLHKLAPITTRAIDKREISAGKANTKEFFFNILCSLTGHLKVSSVWYIEGEVHRLIVGGCPVAGTSSKDTSVS